MKYNEIFRLKEMLENAKIPFDFLNRGRGHYESWQICYPCTYGNGECVCSVIEGLGTYGESQDLLEIMGLLTERRTLLRQR